jgi:hypothetical protein
MLSLLVGPEVITLSGFYCNSVFVKKNQMFTNPTMKMTLGMTMEEMMAAKFSE